MFLPGRCGCGGATGRRRRPRAAGGCRWAVSPGGGRTSSSYSITRTCWVRAGSRSCPRRAASSTASRARPLTFGLTEDRPVGAVGQQLQHGQQDPRLHPPQQRRPGIGRRAPVSPVVEVPVGDQQPVLLQPRVKAPGQGLLAGALPGPGRADRGQHRRPGPALVHGDDPGLGERRRGAVRPAPVVPEARRVRGRVRDVPLHPVDAHQPPPQERPRRDHVRDRPRDLREQLGHGLRAQAPAGLGDPARRRHPAPGLLPAVPVRERPRQPRRDLLVVLLSEQRQRHHQVRRHPRRQLSAPAPRTLPGRLDRVIDRVRRHPRRQHAQRDPVHQAPAAHHPSLRHNPRSSARAPPRRPTSTTIETIS